MEFTPLFVLIGIVLTSGFIAYVCDIVGKKLGKKRLSVFGLRPRHTATTGTVLVGALISITSICLMIVGSKDARDWMIRGGTAMRDLRISQEQNQKAQQELEDTNAKLNTTNQQLNRGRQEQTASDQRLTVLDSKISKGDERIKEQASEQAKLQLKMAGFLTKLSAANIQLADKNKSLGKVTLEYNQVYTSLKKITDQFNQNLKVTAKNEANYRQTLADQNGNIAKLKSTQADLEQRRDALQAKKTELQGDVDDLSAKVKSMSDQLVAEQQTLDRVEIAGKKYYKDITYPSRFGRMIYHYQQEVARIDLPANLTEAQATEAVNTLLDRARIEASQRGAEPGGNTKVADLADLTDGPKGEERLQQIVAKLVKDTEPVVLMACASANTFEKEFVPLDLMKYPNPLVYTKGQVVAESKIDGSESRDEVFKELKHFVSVNLSEKTRQDNMIPEPADQSAFGTVSEDRLYSLTDTVKLKGRQVRLVAKAQTDTHAADPLKLDFEVQ